MSPLSQSSHRSMPSSPIRGIFRISPPSACGAEHTRSNSVLRWSSIGRSLLGLVAASAFGLAGCTPDADVEQPAAGSSQAVAEAPTEAPASPTEAESAESVRPAVDPEGIELANLGQPMDGLLVGGQPSAADLRRAAEIGVSTVINLRGEGEELPFDEAALAEELGLRYVTIPVSGPDDVTAEAARTLSAALDQAGDEPVLLHCASGNRVGALLALEAFHVDGASADDALELGLRSGLTSLEPRVREELSR